jgi:hypothetical protein
MQLTPVQSLVFLLLMGLSISGWIYGIHWKRIASGSTFTKEERVMISLQDQISVLTEKNEELNEALKKAQGEGSSEEPGVQTSPQSSEAVELPKK